MTLIGLMGKAGSGKDTVGEYIKQKHESVMYAFATPIKELTRTLFLFDDEQLYGSKKEDIDTRWGITPRESWQKIGTNIMQFGIYGHLPGLISKVPLRQFWIYHFEMWYNNFINNPENKNKLIIITDVRFLLEGNIIKDLGGIIIEITRPDLDMSQIKYLHSSETESNDIKPDIILINDSSIDNLYKKVDNIILPILHK